MAEQRIALAARAGESFVELRLRGKTHDGRTLRMLTLIDEYTRECLAIQVARRLRGYEVIEALAPPNLNLQPTAVI